MGKAKNTMTVDVDVLVSQMAALIDSKIATALNNAANGAPVYSQPDLPHLHNLRRFLRLRR